MDVQSLISGDIHRLKTSGIIKEQEHDFIYQIQEKINASGIYKRKQKYQNKAKIEHACGEQDPAKQTSGP